MVYSQASVNSETYPQGTVYGTAAKASYVNTAAFLYEMGITNVVGLNLVYESSHTKHASCTTKSLPTGELQGEMIGWNNE